MFTLFMSFFSHRPQILNFPPILPVLVHFPPDWRKLLFPPCFHKFPPCFRKIHQFFTYFVCIFPPPTLTMMHLCITQCTYWTPLHCCTLFVTSIFVSSCNILRLIILSLTISSFLIFSNQFLHLIFIFQFFLGSSSSFGCSIFHSTRNTFLNYSSLHFFQMIFCISSCPV